MIAGNNPEIRKAVDTLYELSADENVRAEYEMRLKAWRDRVSQNEGYFQDGIQKGRAESREEIAKNALAKGLSPDLIRDITGLNPETIKNPGQG